MLLFYCFSGVPAKCKLSEGFLSLSSGREASDINDNDALCALYPSGEADIDPFCPSLFRRSYFLGRISSCML